MSKCYSFVQAYACPHLLFVLGICSSASIIWNFMRTSDTQPHTQSYRFLLRLSISSRKKLTSNICQSIYSFTLHFNSMYKAKIFASHDCWASRISTLFPEEHMSLNNTTWIEDRHALDVFAIRAQTDKNFDAIVAYIKKEKTIKKWAIMEKERTYMIIQVDTYSPQPLIRHVYEYNCFQLAPTILKDGGEYWTIGAPTRDPITRVFSIMKKVGKARLRYITPSCFEALSRFPVI